MGTVYAPTRTSAKPRDVGGFTWECWATGILQTEWRTQGGRLAVGLRGSGNTYWAKASGAVLPMRYRTLETAMKAAAKNSGRRS